MLIATIVFGPFAGAAAAAAIGKRVKAGEYGSFPDALHARFVAGLVPPAGSTLYPSASAGGAPVIRKSCPGRLTFSVTGFRAVYAVITALMGRDNDVLPEYFAHERKIWAGTSSSCCLPRSRRASCSQRT